MVGGFGESGYLQKRIQAAFPTIELYACPAAALAVSLGAVEYGAMDSSVIDSIVMPYSVGVRSAVPFEAALHDPMCRRRIDGRDLATNVYRPFFVKNERIADGSDPRSMKFVPLSSAQTEIDFEVLRSDVEPPVPVSAVGTGLRVIGKVSVSIGPATGAESREIEFTMWMNPGQVIACAAKLPTGIQRTVTFRSVWLLRGLCTYGTFLRCVTCDTAIH